VEREMWMIGLALIAVGLVWHAFRQYVAGGA
jgi:hypothetical protein